MTIECRTLRDRVPAYLDDVLSAEERSAFREHLAECVSCRSEVANVEPSLLFARIPAQVSSDDVRRVLEGVRAGIALAETEKRVRAARSNHRYRIAAFASAAALAAMTIVLPGSARRPADSPPRAPIAAKVPTSGFAPAGERQPTGTYPADATIYDWNPGAATQEPRVVWIVDRSLDI